MNAETGRLKIGDQDANNPMVLIQRPSLGHIHLLVSDQHPPWKVQSDVDQIGSLLVASNLSPDRKNDMKLNKVRTFFEEVLRLVKYCSDFEAPGTVEPQVVPLLSFDSITSSSRSSIGSLKVMQTSPWTAQPAAREPYSFN